MSLYFWTILLSFVGPFFLSFDKKVHFYTHWKTIFPAILIVASGFIVWDIYFTEHGVWGFNPTYLQGIYIANLPLEECLFFVIVPYACVFIYEVLLAYFPRFKPDRAARFFCIAFGISGLVLALTHLENWYTFSACLLAALFSFLALIRSFSWYTGFAVAFVVAIIPFLIVNGILTGGFTPAPIVWYSDAHIIGIRIGTIPMEDLFYNYTMLFPIVAIHEFLKRTFRRSVAN